MVNELFFLLVTSYDSRSITITWQTVEFFQNQRIFKNYPIYPEQVRTCKTLRSAQQHISNWKKSMQQFLRKSDGKITQVSMYGNMNLK